jgi:hypothetical protein
MSRGRTHNALYFAADHDDARAEFAPHDHDARSPLERLSSALRSSDASVLAIDTGKPTPDAAAATWRALEVAEARRAERRPERDLGIER